MEILSKLRDFLLYYYELILTLFMMDLAGITSCNDLYETRLGQSEGP